MSENEILSMGGTTMSLEAPATSSVSLGPRDSCINVEISGQFAGPRQGSQTNEIETWKNRVVRSTWGMTPRESIEARCRQAGVDDVVRSCIEILEGRPLDDDFAYVLAGPASFPVMAQGAGGTSGYWPRVWALRAFLYAWDTTAAHQVIGHLDDPAWRVREMAAKVVARQRIGDAFDAVNRRRHDPVPRVRHAAERALIILVAHEA